MTSASVTSSPDVPFLGLVETTGDALRLIQAARQGIIPRITRRLNDDERAKMICSGAVFIFSVEESGIRRWTEGLSWSASRIAGNFLLYRELLSRSGGRTSYTGKALSTESAFSRRRLVPRDQDQQPTFKPEGLIKKTVTISADGTDYHLVSYYSDEDVRARRLPRPLNRPDIMALGIPQDLVESTNFRYPPRVEVGQNGTVVNIRDVDEIAAFEIRDFPLTPSQHRSSLPSLRGAAIVKAEASSPSLRAARRPRAIRPANTIPAPTVTSRSLQEWNENSGSDTQASVDLDDVPSAPHSPRSPATSSYSDNSCGSPVTDSWHGDESSRFPGMSGHYAGRVSIHQHGYPVPSSSPPSTISFTGNYSSRSDIERAYSDASGTPPAFEDGQSAYYYAQQLAYHPTSYQAEYQSDIPYSHPGYFH